MSLTPLTLFSLRTMAFVPIALWLWWQALDSLILPLNQQLAGTVLSGLFSYEGVSITTSQARTWVVGTFFLIEEIPYGRTWQTQLNVVKLTLGLPLFWCLCAGFWRRKQGGKQLRHVVTGSLLLLLIINITLIFKGAHQIYAVMLLEEVQNLFLPDSGSATSVIKPSRLFTSAIGVSANLLTYCAVFLAPLSFSYYVNRKTVQRLLQAKMTDGLRQQA